MKKATLAAFKPKAYWLVVEPIVEKVSQGGIHIPQTAQEPKIFKILKAGTECGADFEAGGFVMLDETQIISAVNEVQWPDHKAMTKMVLIHNVKGSWPKETE